jgi:probable blue pigment (indigoidine) exporter
MEGKWRWILVTAIAPIAWGSNYFVTRHFLPPDAPLWGALLRALPAGLILLLVARRLPRGSWWWRSLVLGTLNVGAFFVLIYVVSQRLPSGIASTIMAISAAALLLLAWPLLGERPTRFGIIGAAVGLIGVGVLLFEGGLTVDGWGVVASLAAMVLSSIGFILTKRWGAEVPLVALTSWQLIGGGLVVLPFAVILEGAPPASEPSAVLGYIYVAVIATAVAFIAWFAGLRHLPAGTVGLVGLLNPVTGVLLGTLLAGESFGIRQAVGTLLVITGVVVGQRRRAVPT